jgi:ABC-type multidrug transport system fused ATPase/permease subunit
MLLVVGTVAALVHGASMPLFTWLIGMVADAFRAPLVADPVVRVAQIVAYFLIVGAVGAIAALVQVAAFTTAGARYGRRLRAAYFTAMLRQEMAWHDRTSPIEAISAMAR